MSDQLPPKTAGRPRRTDYDQVKEKIRRLKCSINPETGKIFTFKEIGKQLGISGMGASHYLPPEKGNCPSCHRKLEEHKE